MHNDPALRRPNISSELADRIRLLILDGDLAGGERINEVQLAQRLGVSRTPLREAISALAREGTLTAVPRIGCFVKALSVEEFEQLYPIRALLDPEALRLAGIPTNAQIDRLESLNRRLSSARTPEQVIELDDQWHMLLIERCPNAILIELIRDFMRRTRRYELALMREQENVAAATDQHEAIIRALRAADMGDALAALRHNLQGGAAPILEWLKAREGMPR